MTTISIRGAFRAGWTAFTRRPGYLLGLTLATFALFVVTLGNAIVSALAYILYGGYLRLMLQHSAGSHIQFDDLFDNVDFRFVSFAFLALIKGFFILLGFLCFIVPGIYLSVRWMYAELLVIDQGMKPLEALKASSRMTEGNRGKLFLLAVVAFISTLIGLLFLVVGAFVMMVVWLLAIISLYTAAKERLVEVVVEPVEPHAPEVVA